LKGKVVKCELRYNYLQLGERDVSISYFPIKGPAGIDRAACVLQDITERKRAEVALADYAKRLQSLSGRLLEAQESERRRIARELHDEIGQSLTAIKIHLHAAQRLSKNPKSKLKECVQIVDQALIQTQNLSLNLHPPQLDELGLVVALRWHLDRQANAAGLIPYFSADPLPAHLHPNLEIACFRVVQEAITNVIRHAAASRVSVQLFQRGSDLHLVIRDDGLGFNTEAAQRRAAQGTSLGLVGMRERVELAGGRMELNSLPGKGTEIHAVFPWPILFQENNQKGGDHETDSRPGGG
jgi:two-component system sensor histidine kinase UhpB